MNTVAQRVWRRSEVGASNGNRAEAASRLETSLERATQSAIAVHYFDRNLNHIGSIRSAKYDGINYNYTTGKAVELHAHFIEIDTMQPVDGVVDSLCRVPAPTR